MKPEDTFRSREAVSRILEGFVPDVQTDTWEACYFDHSPMPDEFPDVVVRKGRYVVIVNGEPVTSAWTQDGNQRASELAVETLPGFRRRGYGRQAVVAWAWSETRANRVPFYSYELGNLPSEALAKSLGVAHYATFTSYSVRHSN